MKDILFYSVIAIAALAALTLIFIATYKKTSRDRAFIRTGVGGVKVVIDGGALVFPFIHTKTDVNLNTMRLLVSKRNGDALITKDKILVDIEAEFFLRVKADADSVGKAGQTFGDKTIHPEKVEEFVHAKFVNALRAVAANTDLEELNINRQAFTQAVQHELEKDLGTNGLELETVSLTNLAQSRIEFFDENNAMHAEGKTAVTRIIQDRARERNDIEATTRVAIAERNLTAKQRELQIEQDTKFASSEQETAVARNSAERRLEQENARIETDQAIANREIESTQAQETRKIESNQALELARQGQNIAVSERSRDESRAKAEADAARAAAITAEEGVKTAQQTAIAEREKAVALVVASRDAEQAAIGITVKAKAELEAAESRAEAKRVEAKGEAEAENLRSDATKTRLLAEAEGAERVNAAANSMSAEQIGLKRDLALFEALPRIIEMAGKPIEKIDGISIAEISGLGGVAGSGEGGSGGPVGLGDEITRAALRYRTAAPVLDGLLKGVGLDGSSLGTLVATGTGIVPPAAVPAAAPAAPAAPAADAAPVEPAPRPRRGPSRPLGDEG